MVGKQNALGKYVQTITCISQTSTYPVSE